MSGDQNLIQFNAPESKGLARPARKPIALLTEQPVSGLIDPRRKIRRPPLIGMNFLNKLPMGLQDSLFRSSRFKTQHLIGFLFGQARARAMLRTPRVAISLICFTPSGRPAVRLRMKQS